MPVKKRIIKAYFYALGSESVNIFFNKVSACLGVCGFKIGIFRVKKAKSLMVLGCEHGIFHACLFCICRPLFRVIKVGVKVVKIFFVVFIGYPFVIHNPLMACRQ